MICGLLYPEYWFLRFLLFFYNFFLFAGLINCSIIWLCRTSDIWLVSLTLSFAPPARRLFHASFNVTCCPSMLVLFLFGAIINHRQSYIYSPVVDEVHRRWINININIDFNSKAPNTRNSVAFFPFCRIVSRLSTLHFQKLYAKFCIKSSIDWWIFCGLSSVA